MTNPKAMLTMTSVVIPEPCDGVESNGTLEEIVLRASEAENEGEERLVTRQGILGNEKKR